MKKVALVLFIMALAGPGLKAQTNSSRPTHDSAFVSVNTDSGGFYRQPAICDTLYHVFSLMLDSFSITNLNSAQKTITDTDLNKVYTVSNSEKPMPRSKNIYNTPPFAYYCPYQSGKDSAFMFKIFTELVGNVKECLLNGPAKSVEVYYMHDPDKGRTLRYGYTVKELKNGVDPKMKTVSVTIEFNPDRSGRQLDYLTLYRVNLIVHP